MYIFDNTNTTIMKKTLYLLSIVMFAFVSCKDDDGPVAPGNQQQPKTLLTGKWNMIKGEMFTDGKLTFSEDLKKPGCEYDFLDLKSNGKKDETYHNEDDCTPENDAGTWSFLESSKQLTVVDDEDGYTVLYQVVSLTNTDLKLKLLVEDGGAVPANIEVYAYLKK